MEQTTRPTAPGLKWRKRKRAGASDIPYWVAPKKAVDAGFEPRLVRLHHRWQESPEMAAAMVAYCNRLQNDAARFLSGDRSHTFDFAFGTLIDRYLTDPESKYKRLRPSSAHPYTIYAAKLKEHIGKIRVDMVDGRDVQRWFKKWAGVDNLKHPDARLPRANTMLAVLKAATSFGIICRLPGCAEFSAILSELEFPNKGRRTFAPTAAQVEAARAAAHAAGAPSRALTYALQFETTLRQWDVIGQWVPLSDPRPSSILAGTEKWIGPTWAMVDDGLVLRITYGKTEDTSGLRGTYDLSACPMVIEELQRITAPRRGPLIIDERTGLPYQGASFERGWKRDFKAAGLPAKMWNRDLRAGAITEAGIAGASRDDTRKIAGHTTDRMVAEVYDRDRVEAHRRTMALRILQRSTS